METPSIVLLSRQDALQRAMDVASNNIANATTTGFKHQDVIFETYMAEVEPGQTIEYVIDRGTYRDVTQGPVIRTGNELDVALEGPGYLQVETPQGLRFTRAGALQLNAEGELINPAGYKILSGDGQPVVVPVDAKEISIDVNGNVRTDRGEAGRLQAVTFKREQEMIEAGGGLYSTKETPQPTEETRIIQGAIERSNVQPVIAMTEVIEIVRSYQQVQRLQDQENERMRQALRTLSRTSA